jgi:hypothetical protein
MICQITLNQGTCSITRWWNLEPAGVWGEMPCSLVQIHQCCRGKYNIHLQSGNPQDAVQQISPKCWYIFTVHVITSWNTVISINRNGGTSKKPHKPKPVVTDLTQHCRYTIMNLMFMGACIVRIFQYISNKMQCYAVYYIWKLLYLFRVIPPPIVRSTYNCIYNICYLSQHYCYLPPSWRVPTLPR